MEGKLNIYHGFYAEEYLRHPSSFNLKTYKEAGKVNIRCQLKRLRGTKTVALFVNTKLMFVVPAGRDRSRYRQGKRFGFK